MTSWKPNITKHLNCFDEYKLVGIDTYLQEKYELYRSAIKKHLSIILYIMKVVTLLLSVCHKVNI
jgi:hypothetical protein